MSTVTIEVKAPGGSFTDITDDCLFERCSFTSNFNGAPGSFDVYVRDPLQTHFFDTGYEIRCTIDGSNALGGYVTMVGMTSLADAAAMPVDPADYDMRVWHLTGADYNIAFDRRVFRNTSDYLSIIKINETVDGAILRAAVGSYADMGDFDTSQITDIATIPDITYVLLQQGWAVRKEFETLLPFSGAVYYIDGAKNIIWKSYDDAEKRWGFSDDPNYNTITSSPNSYQGATIGYSQVEATQDGSMMANDVLVWGGSEFAGSGGTVFHRSQDSTSQTNHGRWQHSETHFGEQWYKTSAGVTAAADAILNGPPGADATGQEKGLKFPQWQFTFTWNSERVPKLSGVKNHIVAGDLVTIELSMFGTTKLLPVRSLTTSFPNAFEPDGTHLVEFRGTFGLQLSDSFSLWRYVIKNQNRVSVQTQTAVNNSSTSSVPGAQYSGEPTPATDGSTTVFTIPFGYIAGTVEVYLNGLIQRPGTDFTESDPDAGEITMSSPPLSTDNLYIVCATQ